MPRYKISNRITKEVSEVEAPFAQDACESLGWMIGNCHVELLREGPYTYIEHCQKCQDEQDWQLRQQSRRMRDGV